MATHKGSRGSGKDGSGKRNGKISRRALISGLGGGLALTAIGRGAAAKSKGDVGAKSFEPPTDYRTATAQRSFVPKHLTKIVMDSNALTVTYSGKEHRITDKHTVVIDLTKGTVNFPCFMATPSPVPSPGK